MLGDAALKQLADALEALRQGDEGPWQALAPLSALAEGGTDVSIDFRAAERLGAPVIVARPRLGAPKGLTPRQEEVCLALARGLTNKEIARELSLSPATVKDHVHAVLQRLGLSRRSEVAALIHRGGA